MDVFEFLFPITSTLHTLAAVIWVGGMFFAHMVLRLALMEENPPARLQIWSRVFPRFFVWVWLCVVLLPITGYVMVFFDFGGFAEAGRHVEVMHGLGWLMVVLFAYMFFAPFAKFKTEVNAQNWPGAAQHLAVIRRIVTINLSLGLIVIIAGVSGRFWG